MKKYILLIILVLSISVSAQDLALNEIDEETGYHITTTKFYTIGESQTQGGLMASLVRIVSSGDHYFVKVKSTKSNFGCSGNRDSYIQFSLEDGTIMELSNDIMDSDCNGDSISGFVLTKDQFIKLETTRLNKIKFNQGRGYANYETAGEYALHQIAVALIDYKNKY